MSKTPVMILQELMMKRGENLRFEFLSKTDRHSFRCSGVAGEHAFIGEGRTKKEAKQKVAKIILEELVNSGKFFPTPEETSDISFVNRMQSTGKFDFDKVGKLRDLCFEYSLPPPVLECIQENGPPHMKEFTFRCTVASIIRQATAFTKKFAKHLAAEKVLEFFKNNVPERFADVVDQTDNVSKLNEEAAANYMDLEYTWRPNLGQLISDYHTALKRSLDQEMWDRLVEIFKDDSATCWERVERYFEVLELGTAWSVLASEDSRRVVSSFTVPRATPPICVLGIGDDDESSRANCTANVMDYMKHTLFLNV